MKYSIFLKWDNNNTALDRRSINKYKIITSCKAEAPAFRYCIPTSAESMPPVAKMGKPGNAFAIADTALLLTQLCLTLVSSDFYSMSYIALCKNKRYIKNRSDFYCIQCAICSSGSWARGWVSNQAEVL